MHCALCKKDRELANSHVIPEFLFKLLYDEKHRAHSLTTSVRSSAPFIQKGLREKLLCRECENRLSCYEKYAAEEVFHKGLKEIPSECIDNIWIVKGIDYKLFRLFHLSILWRASVSNADMFSQVNLGPHEEPFRCILMYETPGKPLAYPFMAIALCSDVHLVRDYIESPDHLRIEGHHLYRFSFGGFCWLYFVSAHELPQFLKASFLSEEGEMKIYSQQLGGIRYMANFFSELESLNRLPGVTK